MDESEEESDKPESEPKEETKTPKDNAKSAKPFLKRKTKKVQMHKLNWGNVKSRTNCW